MLAGRVPRNIFPNIFFALLCGTDGVSRPDSVGAADAGGEGEGEPPPFVGLMALSNELPHTSMGCQIAY